MYAYALVSILKWKTTLMSNQPCFETTLSETFSFIFICYWSPHHRLPQSHSYDVGGGPYLGYKNGRQNSLSLALHQKVMGQGDYLLFLENHFFKKQDNELTPLRWWRNGVRLLPRSGFKPQSEGEVWVCMKNYTSLYNGHDILWQLWQEIETNNMNVCIFWETWTVTETFKTWLLAIHWAFTSASVTLTRF